MSNPKRTSLPAVPSRREFLKTTAVAAAGAGAALRPARAPGYFAAGSDTLRVGLIGCGGRGTGATVQALRADPGAKLTAMADLFADRLEKSLENLRAQEDAAAKIDVPKERQFVGFDAYKELIADGVDVVLLTTPPHFRPMHLKAAVEAGLHVFAEKPVAVDTPGVHDVLASCEEAAKKNLCVVSGLCLRNHYGFRELIKRIQDGQIGDVVTLYANDYRGGGSLREREPGLDDLQWQCRHWYHFTWLSGDFNVEQHVHFLDVCAWAMGDKYPAEAVGMGGREKRTGEGNIYDHHSVVYEYENGIRLVSNTRQMSGCANDMSAQVFGTKGTASFRERRAGLTITPRDGGEPWVYRGEDNNIYQTEHDELFAAIRAGKPINNGRYMSLSTLLAILGRMTTYTGRRVTWQQAMDSQQRLGPEKYEWGPAPPVEVAVPGVTKLA
jgi:predicted dehydrogenase